MFQSVFSQVFDVVVLGAGYAGFAAAGALRAKGKHVLLVDRQGALLWESGWAFGSEMGGDLGEFGAMLRARHGAEGEYVDGAIAEVVATDWLKREVVPVLYYATPVAVEREGDAVTGVAVAMKEGVRVIRGRQFVDATESGELARLVVPGYVTPTAEGQTMRLFYRNVQATESGEVDMGVIEGARMTWGPTMWGNERVLKLEMGGDVAHPRMAWLPALKTLRGAFGKQLEEAVMTHGSVVGLQRYGKGTVLGDVANVAWAVPGVTGREVRTLGDRYALGLAAAERVAGLAVGSGAKGSREWLPGAVASRKMETEVLVAGMGTGGPLAAIAAARQGAKVVGVEPLPSAGGIGVMGGINYYYYGVRGGLQEEMDQRVREVMPLFAKGARVHGYHPDAKKCVMEMMLLEAGVTVLHGATLYGVEQRGETVTAARVATTEGAVEIHAKTYIDATGDGDLAAHAGAKFVLGRERDGQLHAFSQSSGRVRGEGERIQMYGVNYDAGFVDPTDTEDLTRARLLGISHYLQAKYSETERPTFIAPALGLRMGRLIETDYALSLSDLIQRRTFEDVVGYTGAHYDNHAVDYELESDEAMFWVWACRQWWTKVACEMPYRMLLPTGLGNVWMACRAAGVTIEAHHSMRMQRDIQRLGEVAGTAAALASRNGSGSRGVAYGELKKILTASGALKPDETPDDPFGPKTVAAALVANEGDVEQWLTNLRLGPSVSMYHIYQRGKTAKERLLGMLEDVDAGVSFRAAAVLAMWGETAAEARMLKAVRGRENGFENSLQEHSPERCNRHVPHYIVALALLRRSCTKAALNVLAETAGDAGLPHAARTALAGTLEALAKRSTLNEAERRRVGDALRQLLATPAPNEKRNPQRRPTVSEGPGTPKETDRQPVLEDFTWQLHLAVAKGEEAARLPIHPEAEQFLSDPRTTVRKAFIAMLQKY